MLAMSTLCYYCMLYIPSSADSVNMVQIMFLVFKNTFHLFSSIFFYFYAVCYSSYFLVFIYFYKYLFFFFLTFHILKFKISFSASRFVLSY